MKERKTVPIRIRKEDKEKWIDACYETRMNSAELFSKIMQSREIAFQKRVQLENERIRRLKGKLS